MPPGRDVDDVARGIVRGCMRRVVTELLGPGVLDDVVGPRSVTLEAGPLALDLARAVERWLVRLQKPHAPVRYSVLLQELDEAHARVEVTAGFAS